MRRLILLAPLALLSLVAVTASLAPAAPKKAAPAGLVRGTPQQALTRFKRAFSSSDRQGEWDTLSPGFKRRMSRMAGRTVDVGDYTALREKHRRDPRVRELRKWMPSAAMTRIKFVGDGTADVTLRFGAPILFGQNMRVKMINHELWELWVKGEKQPYWGFMDDKTVRVYRTRKDNMYVVETRDAKGKVTWRKKWPFAQIKGYQRSARWYFHSFGALEEEFTRQLR